MNVLHYLGLLGSILFVFSCDDFVDWGERNLGKLFFRKEKFWVKGVSDRICFVAGKDEATKNRVIFLNLFLFSFG